MSVTPVRCELFGHKPRDIDPTGGDPWMGGPVAITICDRCGHELPHSDTAKAFNDKVRAQRERDEQERRAAQPAPRTKRWWRR